MKVYIRSAGNISPQHSLVRNSFFNRREELPKDRWRAVEPDYTRYVDAKMIRRMSRIVKMGVASAMECLQQAGVEMPGAIITGTAYGCLEDTGIFLRRMIDNHEELLTPTAFIQSTHNTVGAQIALLLKCHGYNNTIVHRGFSFENALTDASLLLKEGVDRILVGGIDEITNDSHTILNRFGLYKKHNVSTVPETSADGAVNGEGAAFFLLSQQPDEKNLAALTRFETIYKPADFSTLENRIQQLLGESGCRIEDIDLVITGHNGNPSHDETDTHLSSTVFKNKPTLPFKMLCGEYPTASGFALWLASMLISEQKMPDWLIPLNRPLKNILIHNHDMQAHHALYLISAC
jgi:3-oxoacyl-(acyl-carrier-protein) synthase